jgi:hypothetical protein
MKKNLFETVFSLLFIISVPVTAIYWLFLSDTRGVDEETEMFFAETVNRYYSEGDVVFPEVDWDLGFLKYLDHGITNVLLTLKESSPQDINLFREDGSKIFFLLKNEKTWEKLKNRLEIDEHKKIKEEKSLVVIVNPLAESLSKKIIFSRDIHKASKVFFSSKDDEKPCSLNRKRWECSRYDWNFVGSIRTVVNKTPKQAVWAHPRTNKNLHVVFDVPQDSSTIHLNTAMLERAVRSRNRSPVRVSVIIDGKRIINYSNRSVREEYYNKIDIPDGAKELELIFTTNDDGQRHFVFSGYIE